MKFYSKTLFFVLALSAVSIVLSKDVESNATSAISKADNKTDLICRRKNCIMKCCPLGKFINTVLINVKGRKRPKKIRLCDSFNKTSDTSKLENNLFSKHPNMSFSEVKAGVFEVNKTFLRDSSDVSNITSLNVYLTDYPEVFLEMPNAYDRWTRISNDAFCWDFKNINASDRSNSSLRPGIWVLFPVNPDEPSRTSNLLLTTAMLVSCFFLLVVLVVYGLLPELRNLCGLILMAYVASLFVAFLLLAVMRIEQQVPDRCLGLTCSVYYFFLASFCWMNVMSYDIWWTFRGYAKARPIHRRGEHFKFLMYCLYAFGLPLFMSLALYFLNNAKLSHIPWFVTPKIPSNGCFLEGGEKVVYLYMPMLVLILCNWLFYIMTAYNVWRLSRGTAVLDSAAAGTPQAHRTHRHRFLVYLKLSVVMGLNWLFEIVSYKYPGYSAWFLSDFYNILIGVSIFLIFVCKRKILRKLVKLFIRCKKSRWHPGKVDSMRSTSTNSDSSTSQETQTLQVCVNPKGPAYTMKSF